MSGVAERLVVSLVAMGVAALLVRAMATMARRRAARQIASAPQQTARILVFHADWCGACAAQRHQLLALDDVEIHHFDVDDDPDAARRHGVRSLPTTIVVSATGDVVAMHHGLVLADALRTELAAAA